MKFTVTQKNVGVRLIINVKVVAKKRYMQKKVTLYSGASIFWGITVVEAKNCRIESI